MRPLRQVRLVDILLDWGRHEAAGRYQERLAGFTLETLDHIDLVLRTRSNLVVRLLGRRPLDSVLAELEPADMEGMLMANGLDLDGWIQEKEAAGDESYAHFLRLVEAPDPPMGRVVAAVEVLDRVRNQFSPFILYDGWHRAAAWRERIRRGRPSLLNAYVIFTDQSDCFMPQPELSIP